MKTFEIKENFANAILNYLADKPYKEVAAFVAGLMQLKPIEEKPKGAA